MTRTRAIGLAGLIGVLFFAAPSPAQPSAGRVRDEILSQERAWSEALIARDTAAVARLIADDYIGIDGRGLTSTKRDEVNEAAPPSTPASGPTVVREELTDVQVRTYGETAVLTAINTQFARAQGVETPIARFRRTTIWVWRDGRWQCVSFHGTRIPGAIVAVPR